MTSENIIKEKYLHQKEFVNCFVQCRNHIFGCNRELLRIQSAQLRAFLDEPQESQETYKDLTLITINNAFQPMLVELCLRDMIGFQVDPFPLTEGKENDDILEYLQIAAYLGCRMRSSFPHLKVPTFDRDAIISVARAELDLNTLFDIMRLLNQLSAHTILTSVITQFSKGAKSFFDLYPRQHGSVLQIFAEIFKKIENESDKALQKEIRTVLFSTHSK